MTHDDPEFSDQFRLALNAWMRRLKTKLPEKLVEAYLNTSYNVKCGETVVSLEVDLYSDEIRRFMEQASCKQCAFITPFNPLGKTLSAAENDARMSDFKRDLDSSGYQYVDGVGVGKLGDWPGEESVFILDVSEADAIYLGKKYQQNAIVLVGSEAIPVLILLQ
jgi:hypothetical protein